MDYINLMFQNDEWVHHGGCHGGKGQEWWKQEVSDHV